jgi:pantoate--beta-alanine ligase
MTPQVHTTIESLRSRLAPHRRVGDAIVLVPTMGALHEGHVALARRARQLGQVVVVSIFVNPLQFGAGEDLDRYPRTLEADLVALGDLADHVFAPDASEMYPDGPTQTRVQAGAAATLFEGASRPGHFDGVLTVVAKLLGIVQPDSVMFGQKDAQQVFLVRQMVRDLNMPVAVEVVPIERADDGLALSSRNRYLGDRERAAALTLSAALRAAEAAGGAGAGVAAVRAAADERLRAEPDVKLDYLAVVDPQTFLPVDDDYRGRATVLVAARVGNTRLIDNADVVIEAA